jgi:hypothetical protein
LDDDIQYFIDLKSAVGALGTEREREKGLYSIETPLFAEAVFLNVLKKTFKAPIILLFWQPLQCWRMVQRNLKNLQLYKVRLKDAVAQDFQPTIFLINKSLMDHRFKLKTIYGFGLEFAEIFNLKFCSGGLIPHRILFRGRVIPHRY